MQIKFWARVKFTLKKKIVQSVMSPTSIIYEAIWIKFKHRRVIILFLAQNLKNVVSNKSMNLYLFCLSSNLYPILLYSKYIIINYPVPDVYVCNA